MKTKKIIFFIFSFLITKSLFSQEIDKISKITNLNYSSYRAAQGYFPTGLYVNECNYILTTYNPVTEKYYFIDLMNDNQIQIEQRPSVYYPNIFKVGDNFWGAGSSGLTYILNNEKYKSIPQVQSGICFTLKKDNYYIVYFIDKNNKPGAIDTNGKIYTNVEALAYLREFDEDKYIYSRNIAFEIGLQEQFDNAEILIWGKKYYVASKVYLQYDNHGNTYSFFDGGKYGISCTCKNSDSLVEFAINNLHEYSKININTGDYSTSWFVGFGGNIYYYIAGEEYTEVFRIRRTWGEPDFYAMAINGYTDDEYGKYVNEVLPKMSKADLRLLRNTIFALYGVHFKSEDLSKHFDKQVWYTDEGKTSADIQLPTHRQKLVEMIQALERQ